MINEGSKILIPDVTCSVLGVEGHKKLRPEVLNKPLVILNFQIADVLC